MADDTQVVELQFKTDFETVARDLDRLNRQFDRWTGSLDFSSAAKQVEEMAKHASSLLDMRVDIIDDLSPTDKKLYEKMLDDQMDARTTSELRGLFEVGRDLYNLGVADEVLPRNKNFTIEQIKSIQKLLADSQRQRIPFEEYLKELNFSLEHIKTIMAEVAKWKNKVERAGDEHQTNQIACH